MKYRHPAIGIDLGTTFSVVACLDNLGRPQTLVNAEGEKLTPSVVLFDPAETIVGKEAVKALGTEAERVAECAKRTLGQRLYDKVLDGQSYPPEVLEGWILNKLRLDTQRQLGICEEVVITVPAYFDEVRRKATLDAGYIAGLKVLDIINEPTAAAIAFGFQQGFLQASGHAEPYHLMVYDLGGGTFDVTVMEIRGHEFTTLATDGDVQLGGRDWDQRLVDFVAEAFLRRSGGDPREDPNTAGRLWRECEEAKRTLSARQRASVSCDYQGQALHVDVSRQQFEELTRDLLDRTAFTVRQTLQAAGLTWRELDRLLLVGGSTRMPAVFEMLRELSGQVPDRSVSPDEAVAHGAALHAGLLWDRHEGRAPRFSIKNVNSHSLGVVATETHTKRRRTAVLIPRNTPLPVTATRTFTTLKANQDSIRVQIVEGESAAPEDCAQIGRCTVHPLPPDLPAQTPIEVQFRYEENGRLTVQVSCAGQKLRHEIQRENSLSPEQLQTWRLLVSGVS